MKIGTENTTVFKTRPEILSHPHIPKPLHDISPRTIMGASWWNQQRKIVYAKYDHHCVTCGVHKLDAQGHGWLEAHECFDIDYINGSCTITSIEPLCHFCHNFIHSGNLMMKVGRGEKMLSEARNILRHGFSILSAHKLHCFPATYRYAVNLGVETFGVFPYKIFGGDVPWSKWHLIWLGKTYYGRFKSYDEWMAFYANR